MDDKHSVPQNKDNRHESGIVSVPAFPTTSWLTEKQGDLAQVSTQHKRQTASLPSSPGCRRQNGGVLAHRNR